MKSALALLLCLLMANAMDTLSPSQTVFAASDPYSSDSDVPRPYTLNVKNHALTPQAFYETSYRALLKRGWKVETNELTRLVGKRQSGEEVYKVEIRFANDVITIGYVQGFYNPFKRNWLKNLAVDIREEIKPLRHKTQIAPPAPAAGP